MATEDLNVRVGATTSDLERGLERGSRAVQQFSERIRERIQTASAVFTGLNQGIELFQKGVRGAEAVWEASFGRMIDRGEQLQAWSRRFQMPVEEVSRFAFASKQAGVGFEDLGASVRTVSKALAESGDKSSEAYRVLTQGLRLTSDEIAHLKTLAPAEQILAIGQAFDRFADSPAKTADQVAIFGRGYQAVLQLVKEGPEAFRANMREADRLGIVWSKDLSDAADDLGDAVGTVGEAIFGVTKRAIGNVETMRDLKTIVANATTTIVTFGQNIPDEQLDRMRKAAVGATQAGANFITEVLEGVIRIAPSVVAALGNITANVASVFAEWNRLRSMPALAAVEADLDVINAKLGRHEGNRPSDVGVGPNAEMARQQWAAEQQALLARRNELLGTRSSLAPSPIRAAYESPVGPDVPAGFYPLPPTAAQLAGSGGGAAGQSYQPGVKADAAAAAVAAAAKAAKEELAIVKDELAQELTAHQQNAGARLVIEQKYLADIKAKFGEKTEAYRDQLTRVKEAEQAAAAEQKDIAQTALDEETDAQLAELEVKRKATAFAQQMGRITKAEELVELIAYYNERFRILSEKLDREAILTGDDPRAQAKIGQQRTQLGSEANDNATTTKEAQTEEQVKEVKKFIQPVFDVVSQAGDRLTQSLMNGTFKWSQFFRTTLASVAQKFTQTAVGLAATWAANQLAMVLATETAEVSKTAATATGSTARKAINATEAIKEIYNKAASAAAGAFEAFSDLGPIYGQILGAIAAGAVFVAVAAYTTYVSAAGGMGEVPEGGAFAQLHPKEMVLPAHLATPLRAALTGGRASTAAGGYTAVSRSESGVGKDITKVSIASTQQPIPITNGGRDAITTEVKSVRQPVQVTGTSGASVPVDVGKGSKMEINNPAGRPVFTHEIQMAGGTIAELASMSEGYGLGGAGGVGASAAGGYDVPKDTRAQLHAREMVLPREHAEAIRRMAGEISGETGSGETGVGPTVVNHLHFIDTRGAQEFIRRHGREIGEAAVNYARRKNARSGPGLRG